MGLDSRPSNRSPKRTHEARVDLPSALFPATPVEIAMSDEFRIYVIEHSHYGKEDWKIWSNANPASQERANQLVMEIRERVSGSTLKFRVRTYLPALES